jgi:hypothetical protein
MSAAARQSAPSEGFDQVNHHGRPSRQLQLNRLGRDRRIREPCGQTTVPKGRAQPVALNGALKEAGNARYGP